MKNWTVQKLVGVGFALVILLSTAICAYSLLRLATMEPEARDLESDHVPGLYWIGKIQLQAQQNSSLLYRLVSTDQPDERKRFEELIAENRQANTAAFEEFSKTLTDSRDREEKRLFEKVKESRGEYLAGFAEVRELVRAQRNPEAAAAFHDKFTPLLDSYLAAITASQEHSREEARRAVHEIFDGIHATKTAVLAGSLASLLLCIGIAFWVVRQLSETLKRLLLALIQVNSSATEMAATLKEQQASANEVASTSVEIGATAKEISANTRELGATMGGVAAVAEQTATLAAAGQSGLSRLEGTMSQIIGATATISGKLAILNEKTGNIYSVVTTINKVADQTNLLSLNAAIEAEKAGEAGLGFAVVATEIRRLADQTAVATYDIEQMVKEMQSAVSAGVMGMDKFSEEVRQGNQEVCGVTVQLGQIIEEVQALTPRFETVNEGMQAQSTAAGQISDALSQLGETAQQSAQALRQNSDAIDQLTLAASGLQGAVAQFKAQK